MRLLGLPDSVYTRTARLTLSEKAVTYDFEHADVFAETGPPSSLLALNPFGRIPCLVYETAVIYETTAICRFVDEHFGVRELQPRSPLARARMNQIISVMDAYGYADLVWGVFVERISKPQEGELPDESVVTKALVRGKLCLQVLEESLRRGRFLVEDSLSLADLHVWPMIKYFSVTPEGEDLLQGTALFQWLQRLEDRKSVRWTRSQYG